MGGMARQEPYGSAADIPSIADMLQKIKGGKLLTRFRARTTSAISPLDVERASERTEVMRAPGWCAA